MSSPPPEPITLRHILLIEQSAAPWQERQRTQVPLHGVARDDGNVGGPPKSDGVGSKSESGWKTKVSGSWRARHQRAGSLDATARCKQEVTTRQHNVGVTAVRASIGASPGTRRRSPAPGRPDATKPEVPAKHQRAKKATRLWPTGPECKGQRNSGTSIVHRTMARPAGEGKESSYWAMPPVGRREMCHGHQHSNTRNWAAQASAVGL